MGIKLSQRDIQAIQELNAYMTRFRITLHNGGAEPHQIIAALYIELCSLMEASVETIKTAREMAARTPDGNESAEYLQAAMYNEGKLSAIGPWMEEFVTQNMMASFGHNPGYVFRRGVYTDKVIVVIQGGDMVSYEAPAGVEVEAKYLEEGEEDDSDQLAPAGRAHRPGCPECGKVWEECSCADEPADPDGSSDPS